MSLYQWRKKLLVYSLNSSKLLHKGDKKNTRNTPSHTESTTRTWIWAQHPERARRAVVAVSTEAPAALFLSKLVFTSLGKVCVQHHCANGKIFAGMR